jgi:hypothetical protein
MEEDDSTHPELQLIKTPAGPGRHFTLYLYDREKNHVCISCFNVFMSCPLCADCCGRVCGLWAVSGLERLTASALGFASVLRSFV